MNQAVTRLSRAQETFSVSRAMSQSCPSARIPSMVAVGANVIPVKTLSDAVSTTAGEEFCKGNGTPRTAGDAGSTRFGVWARKRD